MVVGIDWLQQCGPMWINWEQKILQFWHENELIELRGVVTKTTRVTQVPATQLKAMEEDEEIAHIVLLSATGETTEESNQEHVPVQILELLEEFP